MIKSKKGQLSPIGFSFEALETCFMALESIFEALESSFEVGFRVFRCFPVGFARK
jgi:hypothetical protein